MLESALNGHAERLFLLVFFLLYFGVPALVAWASYSKRLQWVDMRDLWTHNGRADKLAVIILGTWWVHTCSMILWALSKTVSTADYVTYMGWAIPIIAKMWLHPGDEKQSQQPPEKPKP